MDHAHHFILGLLVLRFLRSRLRPFDRELRARKSAIDAVRWRLKG